MNWLRQQWQLKLVALGFALLLWLMVYFTPSGGGTPPWSWPLPAAVGGRP